MKPITLLAGLALSLVASVAANAQEPPPEYLRWPIVVAPIQLPTSNPWTVPSNLVRIEPSVLTHGYVTALPARPTYHAATAMRATIRVKVSQPCYLARRTEISK